MAFSSFTLALILLISAVGSFAQPIGYFWFPEGYYYQQGPFPGILAVGAAGSVIDFRFSSVSFPGSCFYGEEVAPLYYGPNYVLDETVTNFYLSSSRLGGDSAEIDQVNLHASVLHDIYGWKVVGTLSLHIESDIANQYFDFGSAAVETTFDLVINLNLRPLNTLYPIPYIC